MHGPLAGPRVADLSRVLSSPYCTMLPADLGADVVEVQPRTGEVARLWGPVVPARAGPGLDAEPGRGYGGYFASVNRNKRSICLDLEDPAGRERLLVAVEGTPVKLTGSEHDDCTRAPLLGSTPTTSWRTASSVRGPTRRPSRRSRWVD